jgi:hypothetical protein
VFPGAIIISNLVQISPPYVTVNAELDGMKMDVWSGKQQHLFERNATERAQSMAEIEANLQDFKDEFDIK